MPKISPEAYRERRGRIMDAARRCFVRKGIHISVDDICAEARVSKGALYGYFPSKEAVIQAIADEHIADLAKVRAASSAEELVDALLERINNGDRASCRLELEAWAHALTREQLRNRLMENTGELRSSIEQALKRIEAKGKPRDLPSPDMALIIETLAMGLVANAALGRDAEARKLLALLITKLTTAAD
jgi:AcrR family transcriptional regulator